MKIDELAKRIEAEVVGEGEREVYSVNTLLEAGEGEISFLSNPKYLDQVATTRAGGVIVGKKVAVEGVTLLRAADPYYALMQAMVILHGQRRHPHEGVHPRANVDSSAKIGEGTVVYPGAYVGPRVVVGRECVIYPNAVIYEECVLGDRVIIHAGAVIGQDGYGYATHKGEHHKIPQIGNVILEDDVEVGANSCIARAALGSTVIGKGTKVDSQVMVGHNAKVGEHGLIVAQVGIAGSTTIGHHATIAGQVGIAGHLKIGDKVIMAGKTSVINDVADGEILMGIPAMPASRARRVYALFTQLPELVGRVRELERKKGSGERGQGSGEEKSV